MWQKPFQGMNKQQKPEKLTEYVQSNPIFIHNNTTHNIKYFNVT